MPMTFKRQLYSIMKLLIMEFRLVSSLTLIIRGEFFMAIKDEMALCSITLHVCSYSDRIDNNCVFSYSARILLSNSEMAKRIHSPDRSRTPSKKVKYGSTFRDEWRTTHSWLKRSAKGEGFAFCAVCNVHISVSHGGKNDVTKHFKTVSHSANAQAAKTTPKVTSMLSSGPDKVTTAETMFAYFIAEHNLPMSVADHFTVLVKKMFPDSQIAQSFSSMRTKTTHIINRALAPTMNDRITSLCKTEKFSLMVDESNDHRDDKCVTILVRVLDRTVKRISTRFVDLPVCNIGTGANLFNTLNEVFM